jgi:hypothetical protein
MLESESGVGKTRSNTSSEPKRRPSTVRRARPRSGWVLHQPCFAEGSTLTESRLWPAEASRRGELAESTCRRNASYHPPLQFGTHSAQKTWFAETQDTSHIRSLTASIVLHKPHRRSSQIPVMSQLNVGWRWLAKIIKCPACRDANMAS